MAIELYIERLTEMDLVVLRRRSKCYLFCLNVRWMDGWNTFCYDEA